MYYNRDRQRLRLKRSELEYLNSGENAKVLYNNDIVLKEYFFDTDTDFRLNPEMFDIMKDIDNPNFIKLLEIYSDFDLLELLKNRMKVLPFITDAHIAKYYVDDAVNVLYTSKDYILDNFRELEILFNIFTDNSIATDDVKRKNAILNSRRIIIIDPDSFYITKSSKEVLTLQNKKKLLHLFRSICLDGTTNQSNSGDLITWIDTELTNIPVTASTDVCYEISKKLKYARKPIDIFKK